MMATNVRVVLTPEHVPIVLVPAGLGSRFAAVLIDWILVVIVLAPLWWLAFLTLPTGLTGALVITSYFFFNAGFPIWYEVRRSGQTPGKRIMHLRVVDGRGLPLSVPQSCVRNLARAVDGLPVLYGLGGLVCLMDRHYRRLGDIVADTLVITEQRPAEKQLGLLLSPRRFNSLRVPRVMRLIKHRISLEEREFLLALCLRAEQLDAKARFDLFEEVGGYYREQLKVDDPHLSGENMVRDLTALLLGDKST